MRNSRIVSRSFGAIVKITIWAAAVGVLIGAVRASEGAFWIEAAMGGLTGTVIGLGCSVSEFVFLSNPKSRMTRRLPSVALMLLRATVYSLFIVLGMVLPDLLTGTPPAWTDPEFSEVVTASHLFVISAVVAFVISTGFEVTRLLGKEATIALVSGRYTRPRLEDRVILFADVVGSTALAERIGELRFHDFLGEVAQDLAEAVELSRGDVHKYVGDAVIVTWPLKLGVRNGACLLCAEDMHRALAASAALYRERFDTEARLRVAIHCGQVAAGEIGDWKKEIALLGDAMNTTARIESAARDLGVSTILSDDVVNRLPDEHRARLRRLPRYTAAGKQHDLVLWTTETPGI